jgi:hypothetical protein
MKKLIVGTIIALAITLGTLAAQSQTEATSNRTGLEEQVADLQYRLEGVEELLADATDRVVGLEHLRWTEDHATNVVAYKVWDRATTCTTNNQYLNCAYADPTLGAFYNAGYYKDLATQMALNAFAYGQWEASPNEDGDSWTVSVIVPVDYEDGTTIEYGPVTWTVWESTSVVQANE